MKLGRKRKIKKNRTERKEMKKISELMKKLLRKLERLLMMRTHKVLLVRLNHNSQLL